MIPLRDQDVLKQRFERELPNRIRLDLFTQKPASIYIPGREECLYCPQMLILLEELAGLSSRIALSVHDIEAEAKAASDLGVDKVPATVVRGPANRPLRFYGLPSGTQFLTFVQTLIEASRGDAALAPATQRGLRRLKTDLHLQVLMTTTCPYCPELVHTAVRFALQSVRVKLDVVEVAEFPALARRFDLRVVPTTIIDERFSVPGVMDEATLLETLLRVAEGKPLTNEPRAGRGTLFDLDALLQHQQHLAEPRQTSSGLILPR